MQNKTKAILLQIFLDAKLNPYMQKKMQKHMSKLLKVSNFAAQVVCIVRILPTIQWKKLYIAY